MVDITSVIGFLRCADHREMSLVDLQIATSRRFGPWRMLWHWRWQPQ